ncbi:hypothetical protein J1792_00020 [Streptomyces triculaminicus]|uniref:Uncharacterized protein n=2 Tax=Streptomyces TaxID=1883 RepID=A0A939JP86_9ACTN|nr:MULTISPECIES: hypothetical protein [Streptomyces]MBO0651254.1 hypothetical protein [Streptomyces triculaminicus]QSY49589.1 hypothetical protein J3S04_00020 [Streptomyces griseocarneus]
MRFKTHPSPTVGNTARPVPPWAIRVARVIPLAVLPSCIWRLPFAFNYEMGQVYAVHKTWHWWVILYVFGLSLLSEGLAYMSFGLVAGWGEVVPSWIPFIGGRRVAPLAAIIPATLGALGLIALWDQLPFGFLNVGGFHMVGYSSGWWKALAATATLPLTLWGPLLLALTYAYYKRRRGE